MTLTFKKSFAFAASVGAIAMGAMQSASAAVDTAGIVAAGTDVATVGAAVFLVYVAVKAFHLVRRSL